MSFGLLFGRPKISHRSLEKEFKLDKSSNPTSIGAGGHFNAGVFVVRRRPDDRKCVEKRFKPRDVLNGRAEFEMFAVRELSHRNVVEYLHGFIDANGPVPRASMYMEYADKGTLDDIHRQLREEGKWWKESALWNLATQLANAVAYLQYGVRNASSDDAMERRPQPDWIGIVHRDIKPANIFFRTDTQKPYPRAILGDFGQAIREDNDNWEREFLGGDRTWAPPERPGGNYPSDWWAVGAVVQATCRREGQFLPEGGQRIVGAGHRYTDELDKAILALMRPDPRERLHIRSFAKDARIAGQAVLHCERHPSKYDKEATRGLGHSYSDFKRRNA